MVEYKYKVKQLGNSVCVVIPNHFKKELGVDVGDLVQVHIERATAHGTFKKDSTSTNENMPANYNPVRLPLIDHILNTPKPVGVW